MKFSFVTCVNDFIAYEANVADSLKKQIGDMKVETIPVDNTNSNYSAASALNFGRDVADGDIIIFCHQDVIFPENWIQQLDEQMKLVGDDWGVLGVFGLRFNGTYTGHIDDPHGDISFLPLPAEVQSLDEVCLIISRDSELRFDEDLGGFHFYGADLCLQARGRKLKNYAINACLKHLSGGKKDSNYFSMAEKFCNKWRKRDCPVKIIETTCGIYRTQNGVLARLFWLCAKIRKKIRMRLHLMKAINK